MTSDQDNIARLRRALGGTADEGLSEWVGQLAELNRTLHRDIQRQDLEFQTLFEIASQITARSFETERMLAYLSNTLRGHFAVSKVVLFRPVNLGDELLQLVEAKGLASKHTLSDFSLPTDGELSEALLAIDAPLILGQSQAAPVEAFAEIETLARNGLSLLMPLVLSQRTGEQNLQGILCLGGRMGGNPFSDIDLKLLEMLGKMIAICLHNEQLYRRSIVDDLTGVRSRGHFEAQLGQEVNRIRRYGKGSLALIMLDVDHFKRINDEHGHPTGDQVLREIAQLLQRTVRNADSVARYGGEEFVMILIEITKELAVEVSERIRSAIEQHVVELPPDRSIAVTASLGIACYPADAGDVSQLVAAADKALYRSKGAGRNRVTVA